MRILYLCHRIPYPPNKGEKIRAFQQIRAIAGRHEVDLFTLADDPADLAHVKTLERYCRRVTVARLRPYWARARALPSLLTRTPLTLPYFYSRTLARAVDAALQTRPYDRIFVFCSAMAQYVEGRRGIPVVLDLVDVDSNKWAQYAAFFRFPWSAIHRREAARLEGYERRICGEAAAVLVTTEREAELVRRISPGAAVSVAPVGVDANYFDPGVVKPDAAAQSIIFVGDMSYFPNQEAVRYFAVEVFPRIRREWPHVRFDIVGRNPSPKVRRLIELEGVRVTGSVPDVRPYMAASRVAVAPFTIAAGIQNKVLEAMAYGLPVVATPRAVQGLSAKAAGVVETAETAEDMAGKILRLLKHPESAQSKGVEGRRVVMDDYNWADISTLLLELLERPAEVRFSGPAPAWQANC